MDTTGTCMNVAIAIVFIITMNKIVAQLQIINRENELRKEKGLEKHGFSSSTDYEAEIVDGELQDIDEFDELQEEYSADRFAVSSMQLRNICFVIVSVGVGLLFYTGIIIITLVLIGKVQTVYYYFTNIIYGILALIYLIILLQMTQAINKLDNKDIEKEKR